MQDALDAPTPSEGSPAAAAPATSAPASASPPTSEPSALQQHLPANGHMSQTAGVQPNGVHHDPHQSTSLDVDLVSQLGRSSPVVVGVHVRCLQASLAGWCCNPAERSYVWGLRDW